MWVEKAAFDSFARTVDRIDLAPIVRSLTALPRGLRHPRTAVLKAMNLYRSFLIVKGLHRNCKLVPSMAVDVVWHTHILMTEKYHADCQFLFGDYLHHDPLFGTRGISELQEYRAAKNWTKQAMMHYFAIDGEEYTSQHIFDAVELQKRYTEMIIGRDK